MNTEDRRRIDTWKEIAAFLDRDGRTVQRWEKTRNLPVHRIPGGQGGIFAYSDELTQWLNHGGTANDQPSSSEASARTSTFGATGGPTTEKLPVKWVHSLPLHRHRAIQGILLAFILAGGVFAAVISVYRHTNTTVRSQLPLAEGPLSTNPRAKEAYLRGRFLWSQRQSATLLQALDLFKEAERLDPHFAAAFVGEAETYELLPEYQGMPPIEAFALAERAARQAIALDPDSSAAHRAYAFALFYGDWHAKAAFAEFDRAVELDPNSSQTHHWYANALMAVRDMDDASKEMQRARELDPASTILLINQAFLDSNRGESAQQAIDKLQELAVAEPKLIVSRRYIAVILLRSGRIRDWAAEMAEIAQITKSPEDTRAAELMRGLPANEKGDSLGQQRLCAARNDAMIARVVGIPDIARACMNSNDIPHSVALWKKSFQQHDPQWLSVAVLPLPAQLAGDASLKQLQFVVQQQINAAN